VVVQYAVWNIIRKKKNNDDWNYFQVLNFVQMRDAVLFAANAEDGRRDCRPYQISYDCNVTGRWDTLKGGKYYGGGPRWNPECCSFVAIFASFFHDGWEMGRKKEYCRKRSLCDGH
jgi:hypothetical protein